MCDNCQSFLKALGGTGRSGKKHDSLACPLRRAQYCGICASHGHSPSACPDPVRAHREPEFVEQLLPASILEEYCIQTQTRLPAERRPATPPQPVLEILDDDKAVRSFLIANNMKPMGRVKENRRLIQKIADREGRRLIWKKPMLEQNEEENTETAAE